MSNTEQLARILTPIFADSETIVDDALVERMAAAVEPLLAERFVVLMSGAEFVQTTFEGIDGLREAWRNWLEAFERVTFEIESVEDVGENVLTLARQVGVSRHGIEIEQPSAAVWKFRDGRLARLEFHLDREMAARSAHSAQE